jgi:hypothetical protein
MLSVVVLAMAMLPVKVWQEASAVASLWLWMVVVAEALHDEAVRVLAVSSSHESFFHRRYAPAARPATANAGTRYLKAAICVWVSAWRRITGEVIVSAGCLFLFAFVYPGYRGKASWACCR